MTIKSPSRAAPNLLPAGRTGRSRLRRFPCALIVAGSLILGQCGFSFADSIFIGTLERKNVTISSLKDDILTFQINGRISETQASKVSRLIVTGETPLNDAEEAYSTSKWNQAVDNYQRAIRTTAKPWVKDWAAARLIDAAGKSGRFDAAASAYIQMLLKDPTGSTTRPAMPDSKSTFLDSAVTEVNTALADKQLSNDQRQALLGYLIELQRARKDQSGAQAALEQLSQLPGADLNIAGARQVLADARLAAAQRALEAKDYPQAIAEINGNKSLFVDTRQQADALYLLAEARAAQAGTDKQNLQDAALAYMRVVALAKAEPTHPHVVDSLVKTADILERIGEPKSAAELYQQIVKQYPDDPQALSVRNKLTRINPAK